MDSGIVDAHQHLWDPAERDYPWMTDEVALIRRRFDDEQLAALAAEAGVVATVAVQAVHSESETLALRRSSAPVAGVVGWVDLESPGATERLAALGGESGGAPLVGIRHQAQDERDPGWLARPAVVAGIRAVGEAGLPFDVLIRAREHAAAVALIDALPDVRFVIDHAAKPEIADDGDPAVARGWRSRMRELASRPNTVVKVSGLLTEGGPHWRERPVDRYLREAVEIFGPARSMWGSDWPVSTLATSYAEVLAVAQTALADLAPHERADVFAGTARRTYDLERDLPSDI